MTTWNEALHPREGGKFAPKGGGGAGKGKGSSEGLSYNGRTGAGYGKKGGDNRVSTLQKALNRLGLTDAKGNKLAVDGKLGPRTTAAIKKAQRALGLKADGVATPALLASLRDLKDIKDAKKKAPAKKVAPAPKGKPPVVKKITPIQPGQSAPVRPGPHQTPVSRTPAKKAAPRKAAPSAPRKG